MNLFNENILKVAMNIYPKIFIFIQYRWNSYKNAHNDSVFTMIFKSYLFSP